MDIELQWQPNNSTCGQTSVAMIVNRPVQEVIERFGHKKGTHTKEVVRVLRSYGFKTSNQRISKGIGPHPELCILAVMKKGTRHWAVLHQGIVYCPSLGIAPLSSYSSDYRLSSYILVEEKILLHNS